MKKRVLNKYLNMFDKALYEQYDYHEMYEDIDVFSYKYYQVKLRPMKGSNLLRLARVASIDLDLDIDDINYGGSDSINPDSYYIFQREYRMDYYYTICIECNKSLQKLNIGILV